MFKFNKDDLLEEIINREIEEVKNSGYLLSSKFTIHIDDNVEVQIMVTKDDDEISEEILPELANSVS
jgi:hypothetical protein